MRISEIYSWGVRVLDINRIAKNKADILDVRAQAEQVVSVDTEAFLSDKRNSLSLRYLLIEAVEAITDVCQHILAKTKGVACDGYVDCIVKAGNNAIITIELSNKLRRLADLRNSLIHRYWIVNDEELYSISKNNIGDLSDFLDQIDAFVAGQGG